MAANPKFSVHFLRSLYGALRSTTTPARRKHRRTKQRRPRDVAVAEALAAIVATRTAAQRDLARIARQLSASVAELIGRSRFHSIASKRHIAAWALRQAGYSFPTIGLVLRREHSTIIHSVRMVDARREVDEDFRCSTDALRARMEHAENVVR